MTRSVTTERGGAEPDPELVLRQTLRAMAGGPARAEDRESGTARAPRGSDLRWLVLIGVLALLTGMVLGVGSLWLF